MKLKSYFLFLTKWFNDAFLSPEKKLEGEWYLFEYYTERDEELIHVKEDTLHENERYITLNFGNNGQLRWTGNINLSVFERETVRLNWERKLNFLALSKKYKQGEKIHFQYAVEKNILKLLRKTKTGEINFFGFFKRPEPAKNN